MRATSYSTLHVPVKKLDFHSHVSQNSRVFGSWDSCIFFRMTLYLRALTVTRTGMEQP